MIRADNTHHLRRAAAARHDVARLRAENRTLRNQLALALGEQRTR